MRPMSKKRRLISSTTKKKLYVKGSDFCIDMAKLVFAGIILAGIMGMDFHKGALVGVASLFLLVLIFTGIALFIKGNQKQ